MDCNEKIGLEHVSEFGSRMRIIDYRNCNEVDILFVDYNWVYKNARYDGFTSGQIRCPYEKRATNIGYLGEGEYVVSNRSDKRTMKRLNTWQHILSRCYNEEYHKIKPSYKGCTVCEEWHNFQSFAKWYDENFYEIEGERIDIDKDILVKGNKVYSPETCVFAPQTINTVFTKSDSCRGKLPIGVTMDRNRYRVRVCNPITKKRINVGSYGSVEEAFEKYKTTKEKIIKEVAENYKDRIPNILYKALYKYEVEITD